MSEKVCPSCGKKISIFDTLYKRKDGTIGCNKCTSFMEKAMAPLTGSIIYPNESSNQNTSGSTIGGCPKCGSSNITVATSTIDNRSKKGYGVGKGICGAIIAGPFGLLCGLCGSNKTTGSITTQHTRICNQCGHKFLYTFTS